MEYLMINAGVAVGIGADAMLATLVRSHMLSTPRDVLRWATAIGFTHWLFPMTGFVGGWYLVQAGVWGALVFGLGAILLGIYVVRVLKERMDSTPPNARPQPRFWLAVWAVSIDALVTGPGKSAATAHWNQTELWWSFPLVGALVFILVGVSAYPAFLIGRRVRAGGQVSARAIGSFFVASTWTEISVFAWFCLLSTAEAAASTTGRDTDYWIVSAACVVLCCGLYSRFGSRVSTAQHASARTVARLGFEPERG